MRCPTPLVGNKCSTCTARNQLIALGRLSSEHFLEFELHVYRSTANVQTFALPITTLTAARRLHRARVPGPNRPTKGQLPDRLVGKRIMKGRPLERTGVRRRAEFCYQQLDALRSLHRQVRHDLLVESQKHRATELLRQIPSIGPIRAALLVALIQTPHRFRTKRQLWAYSGLGSLTVPLCTSMSSVKRERVATVREGGPFFASPSAYPCLP